MEEDPPPRSHVGEEGEEDEVEGGGGGGVEEDGEGEVVVMASTSASVPTAANGGDDWPLPASTLWRRDSPYYSPRPHSGLEPGQVLRSDDCVSTDGRVVKLTLSAEALVWEWSPAVPWAGDKQCSIACVDMLGVQHEPGSKTMTVHWCPLANKRGTIIRAWKKQTFTMASKSGAEWVALIREVLLGPMHAERRHHIAVLVNPFGGTKRAPQLWRKVVQPMLAAGGVTVDMVETQHAGHAGEWAQECDLRAYDALFTISGDGLMWEVVNGFMKRPDWWEAMALPLGHIPGGSGNGLANSRGVVDVVTATFHAVTGHAVAMDMASVLQSGERWYSFLMLSWGFAPDADLESDRYRWMGSARFTAAGVKRLIDLRSYSGDLWYLPEPGWDRDAQGQWSKKRSLLCDAACVSCCAASHAAVDGGPEGPRLRYLPSMPAQELPPGVEPGEEDSNWVHVAKDDFFNVMAVNTCRLSYELFTAPWAHLNDGCFDLQYTQIGGRLAMAGQVLKWETGLHVNDRKHLQYVKIRALKLTPSQDTPGKLDIDGELMSSCEPVALEVHPGLMRYVTRRPNQ